VRSRLINAKNELSVPIYLQPVVVITLNCDNDKHTECSSSACDLKFLIVVLECSEIAGVDQRLLFIKLTAAKIKFLK
jgi:hypothetical protein